MDPVQPDSPQTVAALQARLATYEQQAQRSAVQNAVGRVLDQYPLNPGAREQITKLVEQDISVHREGDGLVATAPNYEPVETFLKTRLAAPEYSHFLRQDRLASTTPHGPPSPGSSGAWGELHPWQQPGESLGATMIRMGTAKTAQTQATDSRLDPSKPMALGRRGLPPRS